MAKKGQHKKRHNTNRTDYEVSIVRRLPIGKPGPKFLIPKFAFSYLFILSFCILFHLYIVIFVFFFLCNMFVFCPICFSVFFYFVPFVFFYFVFCHICILSLCILSKLYFVLFVNQHILILI